MFKARDRFGEQGIVCYVVADLRSRRITDFVMSCRAMGRTLEFFAYRHICEDFASIGDGIPPKVDFRKTEKNAPFAAFLEKIASGDCTTYCECIHESRLDI